VGAAPYYEAATKRATSLAQFAEVVSASGSGGSSFSSDGNGGSGGSYSDSSGGSGGGSSSDGSSGSSRSVDYLFLGLYAESDAHATLEAALAAVLPGVIAESLRSHHLFYRASMQFALGPAGSGSPPHYHMAAVNTLAYGAKRWTLLPPRDAVYSALPAREWHAAGGPAGLRGEGRTVVECVQRAGDVLYVPDGWGHAVLNLQPSVGFAAEVATARGHSMRLELRAAR